MSDLDVSDGIIFVCCVGGLLWGLLILILERFA